MLRSGMSDWPFLMNFHRTRRGQTLALAKASEQWKPDPNGGGACLEVADLDAAVAHVKSHDVRVVMEIQDYSICRMALIADPDGNTLALHQRKPNHPDHRTQ